MNHRIGQTQNGVVVHVDLIKSDAARHIAQQPSLLTLAAEALEQTNLDGSHTEFEYNMGRMVGYDYVIEESDDDAVFYARIVRDDVYTRFTKKGNPFATKYLAMILRPGEESASYEMHDIWIGRLRPARPGSERAVDESDAYWRQHAVVFENQAIQSRTVTKTCPYAEISLSESSAT